MLSRSTRTQDSFVSPIFEMGWGLGAILITMALVIFGLTRTARAETTVTNTVSDAPVTKHTVVHKRTTTITEKDEDGDGDSTDTINATVPSAEAQRERVMTAKFGSRATAGTAGCKTADLTDITIRELKSDCNAWLKDRKSELKGKYLTGSCEENCEDCGMNLQRCTVNGSVHYTAATVK